MQQTHFSAGRIAPLWSEHIQRYPFLTDSHSSRLTLTCRWAPTPSWICHFSWDQMRRSTAAERIWRLSRSDRPKGFHAPWTGNIHARFNRFHQHTSILLNFLEVFGCSKCQFLANSFTCWHSEAEKQTGLVADSQKQEIEWRNRNALQAIPGPWCRAADEAVAYCLAPPPDCVLQLLQNDGSIYTPLSTTDTRLGQPRQRHVKISGWENTWRRDFKVLSLIDVGAARPRVEGWNQCRELSLEDELIVPHPPPRALQVVLFLLLQPPANVYFRLKTRLTMQQFINYFLFDWRRRQKGRIFFSCFVFLSCRFSNTAKHKLFWAKIPGLHWMRMLLVKLFPVDYFRLRLVKRQPTTSVTLLIQSWTSSSLQRQKEAPEWSKR